MRLRRPPTLTAVVAVAALSLLAAGCGGAGSPGVANVASSTVPGAAGSAGTSPTNALLVAGRCLRQHGLVNMPDPTIATSGPAKGQAVLDKGFFRNIPSSVMNSAMSACHTALAQAKVYSGSNGGGRTPQEIQDGLAFSRCVRRHGISNFPDPNGQGSFNLAGTGINQHSLSPAQLAAAKACLSSAHGAVHIPIQGTGTSNSGQ